MIRDSTLTDPALTLCPPPQLDAYAWALPLEISTVLSMLKPIPDAMPSSEASGADVVSSELVSPDDVDQGLGR